MVLIRAREYERAKKVLKAHIESGGWIYGLVKGSDVSPYSQVISYREDGSRLIITGDCTCPTGKNCKHVAAVLFHLLATKAFDKQSKTATSTLAPTNPILERWLASVRDAAEDRDTLPEGARQELLFILKTCEVAERPVAVLQPMTASIGREGNLGEAQSFRIATLRAQTAPRYLRRSDLEILKRLENHLKCLGENVTFDLSSVDAPSLLTQVIETGRCHWSSPSGPLLRLAPAVKVEPFWSEDPQGFQKFKLRGVKGKSLPMCPPWFVDSAAGVCGPLDCGMNPRVAQSLCSTPPIAPEHSSRVRQVLGSVFGLNSPLVPSKVELPEFRKTAPKPVMTIGWFCARNAHSHSSAQKNYLLPGASIVFKYGNHVVDPGNQEIRVTENGVRVLIERDLQKEDEARQTLKSLGWNSVTESTKWVFSGKEPIHFLFEPVEGVASEFIRDQLLLSFLAEQVPVLTSQGWSVIWEDGRSIQVDSASLGAQAKEGEAGNLELSLTATVQGSSIDLSPILRSLEKNGYLNLDRGANGNYYFKTESGLIAKLPQDKLRDIFIRLEDLFGGNRKELILPKDRCFELRELGAVLDRVDLPHRIQQAIDGLDSPLEETHLTTEISSVLRPYQREGIEWLHFLKRFGFGGVLADDMGLGKTLQTLGLIASLKSNKKLKSPALIVAPTSTLPNWSAEIKRFAPNLKVLLLHGSDRKESFVEIDRFDVVLTSYPLLVRDRETLLARSYSVAVLDEAQHIKNPSTHAAKAAYQIRAEMRLALSGTPVENHLEELWSIFRFVLPDLLGGQTEFRREFRTPIEVSQSRTARELLERRIRPFFLRRTKEQVAPELPAKTQIIDFVSLDSGQRELYDSVSLASDRQIRESILERGWDETRFEALQALLRLRQICCDPRLIKQQGYESSKLDRLISMLLELKAEGRKTLVFSQFTTMLDLIETRLKQEGIDWVRLCGSTKDRATPVQRFQAGEVDVFLISLKAGGVGLNLTAADTVIHFDPWWNPAVERQATDRAHRIGQDKPVFVFKLVATDTIEERIMLLQEKKADLADRIFSDDGNFGSHLTPQDLQWMLGQAS